MKSKILVISGLLLISAILQLELAGYIYLRVNAKIYETAVKTRLRWYNLCYKFGRHDIICIVLYLLSNLFYK